MLTPTTLTFVPSMVILIGTFPVATSQVASLTTDKIHPCIIVRRVVLKVVIVPVPVVALFRYLKKVLRCLRGVMSRTACTFGNRFTGIGSVKFRPADCLIASMASLFWICTIYLPGVKSTA